ncbi:MAG TPA: hypothetical protein DDZ88_10005 [Verrucomicrobiales bacterium]|nr:hypothetical protein [Verrucomicrobiales bacterium]
MQQNWSIRTRAHQCALTGRPFEDGETFHTTIHFDPQENGYVRRDVCAEAWPQEREQRKPVAAWKNVYQKVIAEAKPEIAPKESAQDLLQRFIEDGDPKTENARYILALMLERKRQLVQTAEKEVDGAKMLFYENKKTGEIFIVRDPELRLDEVAQIQDEVASILAFGGPAAEAAKAVGVTLTVDGVVPAADTAQELSESEAESSSEETIEPTVSDEPEEEASDDEDAAAPTAETESDTESAEHGASDQPAEAEPTEEEESPAH